MSAVAAAVAAWPLSALAQRASIPFIGYLSAGSPNEREGTIDAFRLGLKQGGFVDGQDVAIEFRWAEGRFDRLPRLAKQLIDRKVVVIATGGGPAAAVAAKSATATIPIVFLAAGDPVKLGLVASLSHPGGNLTGIGTVPTELEGRRLQMIRDLLPAARKVAYLSNPHTPSTKQYADAVRAAAQATATNIEMIAASNDGEIDAAFAAMKKSRTNAVLVSTDAVFTTKREQLIALAARHGIPAFYSRREFAVDGGLMSYGPDYRDAYRLQGLHTARVLKGARPADLPVIQETKMELVLNLRTAKKLGLSVSRDFLARVDEVIE